MLPQRWLSISNCHRKVCTRKLGGYCPSIAERLVGGVIRNRNYVENPYNCRLHDRGKMSGYLVDWFSYSFLSALLQSA